VIGDAPDTGFQGLVVFSGRLGHYSYSAARMLYLRTLLCSTWLLALLD